MYIYIKQICTTLVLAIGCTVIFAPPAEARLVYTTEDDGVSSQVFNLDNNDTADDFVELNFGLSSGAQLQYDVANDKFLLNRDLDLQTFELQDFKLERLATDPACGPTDAGRVYYNTTSNQTLVCDGTGFNVLENPAAITGADITDGSIGDEDLNLADITLADFTNDAGFLTTVDVSDDTNLAAGTGATLTGDTLSVDLGTDIATGELQDDAVTSAKILDATVTAADLADDSVSDAEIDFANITLSDFTNDAGFVTTDNDTTYTAGTGLNLVGTTFSTTLGTSIDDTELDFGSITLADFTNDAGFLTSVDISDNTNLAVGIGATLTGDTISVDLGTSIDATEIETNAVADDEIDYTAVTLADFINDAGFVTTDNDTTYTAGTGLTLTGTSFSNDLGTSIDDTELDFGTVTLADFTNDAGFLTTVDVSDDTNLAAGTGATLTGDTISVDLGTTIETGEITDGTITFADLDNTDITLADFTNDAGFVTTDNDTTYTAGTGLTLTGTTFSNDLGSDIDISEIVSAGVGDANRILTTDGVGTPQWEDRANFATAAQGSLADTALQSGDNISELTNDAGFITTDTDDQTLSLVGTDLSIADGNTVDLSSIDTDTDTTYTAGTGLTLTGTTFSSDLGTSIDATEIDTDAVADDEIDYTAVTLADFTNDAGFVTTDNDTTYTAGTGLNLVGTTFSTTLGTSIDDTELDFGSVTLADFTNDAGFLTTVDVSDDTNLAAGTGATLTGDEISVDLGTSIDSSEIDTDAVADDEIDYTAVTLSDFTNDAGFLTAEVDGSVTNEIQDLSLTGNTLSLTDDATTVDLSTYLDNTDTLDDLTCTEGQYAAWNNTLSQWECQTVEQSAIVATGKVAADGTELDVTGANVVRNSTGNYTVTLDTALSSADYAVQLTSEEDTGLQDDVNINISNQTASSFQVQTHEGDNGGTAGVYVDRIFHFTVIADSGSLTALSLDDDTLGGLACSNDEIPKWNGTTWICAVDEDNGTTYTAGTGLTLTGNTFSNDLGTSIDDTELDFGSITLADFANDAGFLTTVDISDDTNLTAGTGATLTGDTISVDLGTSIDSSEIEADTIEAADINTDAVTSDELANDAVDNAAIQNNAVDGTKIALGSDAAGDIMYYDGTDWARLAAGTANQVLQMNTGATAPVWNDNTGVKYDWIDIFGCVRGSASAGTVGGGKSPVIRFDGNNDSQIRCSFAVPDDWQTGTDINLEIYYSPGDNSAGDVDFDLEYAAFGAGEVISSGAFTDTIAAASSITASTELEVYELNEDIPAANLAADDMVNFRLRREPGDAADTYGNAVNIHMIRVAYTGKRLE